MRFSKYGHKRHTARNIILAVTVLFIGLLVLVAALVRNTYKSNLEPLSTVSKTQVITIEPGATTSEIARSLKAKNIIKSDWAFEWYVRNEQLRNDLKAGTYVVDQNQSVQEIVQIIVDGKVATDLVTIFPGKRLEETKKSLISEFGFSETEVEEALKPENYQGHPALTDKPNNANLEGYLYPETFQRTAETEVKDIIELSLDEMDRRLTPEVRQRVADQGLTLHEAVTLASIIEGEVTSKEDREKVAQVFIKRLNEGIRLESNATDEYAEINPEYNSYKIDGLPPGPVSNFTDTALNAIAYPTQTDFLYFVSGDNGQTHFSKTLDQHETNIEKYCTTLCGR